MGSPIVRGCCRIGRFPDWRPSAHEGSLLFRDKGHLVSQPSRRSAKIRSQHFCPHLFSSNHCCPG
jgi:hypothetical protein